MNIDLPCKTEEWKCGDGVIRVSMTKSSLPAQRRVWLSTTDGHYIGNWPVSGDEGFEQAKAWVEGFGKDLRGGAK